MAIILVRHALAVSRSRWAGEDDRRPLTARGDRQALALVELLADHKADALLASPTARCRATLAPLAEDRGMKVKTSRALREGRGDHALDLVVDAVDELVLCTHGDVVEHVLGGLRQLGWPVPPRPRNAKGAAWLLGAGRCTYLSPGA